MSGGFVLTCVGFLCMNAFRFYQCAADKLVLLALTGWFLLPLKTLGATEEKLEVLRTKTDVYTNVTVTTKAANYVFILHAGGMASVRVADLPLETREQLGYVPKGGETASTNAAAAWAKRELAKLNVTQVASLRKQVEQKLHSPPPAQLTALGLVGPKLIYAAAGVALLIYLFYCYCLMLICRKAGYPPGVLIWLPVLQLIPMLRAAGMSAWWLLAYLVPVLNLVPTIMWPFKISQARGKSMWVGLLLLLPITSFFAFLYLAFSNGAATDQHEEDESKVMSLQTV